MKLITKQLLTLLCCVFVLSAPAFGQNKFEKWSIEFKKEVEWMKMTEAGILLLGVKNEGVYGIDPVDGSELWHYTENNNVEEELVEVVGGSNYILIHGKGAFKNLGNAYIIDVTTGETIFQAKDKVQALTGGVTPMYQNESLILVANDRFVSVKAATGEVIWDNPNFVGEGNKRLFGPQTFRLRPDKKMSAQMTLTGNQPFLFDSENTFISHLVLGHLAKYSAETGKRIWTFDFKENGIKPKQDVPSAPQFGYATMVIDYDNNILFFPIDETVIAIDTQSGKLLWEADKRLIKAKASDMALVDGKLVVMCDNKGKKFIAAVNPKTGESLWEDVTKVKNMQQFVINDGGVYALAGKSIVKVNLSDGSTELLTKKGVQLGGKESPEALATYQDKLIITSSQNVLGFTKDGEDAFSTYLKPIKESGFAIAGKLLTAMALNAMSAASAYQTARITGRDQRYQTYSFPTKRFKNSKDRGWYKYITTKVDDVEEGKDFGVARVDIRTGEVVKQIAVGERDITYEIDEIDHLLYTKNGKKTITCYEF